MLDVKIFKKFMRNNVDQLAIYLCVCIRTLIQNVIIQKG